MSDDASNLNLNGEFLGVTSMAVYSAPWFLQTPLIVLVGLLFIVKVTQGSSEMRTALEALEREQGEEDENYDKLVSEANRLFFGFTVDQRVLPSYWIGTTIYLITAVYCVYQLLDNLI